MGKFLDLFKKEEDFRLKDIEEVLKKLSESKNYYCNIATKFGLSGKELTTIRENKWELVSFASIPLDFSSNCMCYIFRRI